MKVEFELTNFVETSDHYVWSYEVQFSHYLHKHYHQSCIDYVRENCNLPRTLMNILPIEEDSVERGVTYKVAIRVDK